MKNGKLESAAGPMPGKPRERGPDSGEGAEAAVYVNIPMAAHMIGSERAEIRRLIESGRIESVVAGSITLVPMAGIGCGTGASTLVLARVSEPAQSADIGLGFQISCSCARTCPANPAPASV